MRGHASTYDMIIGRCIVGIEKIYSRGSNPKAHEKTCVAQCAMNLPKQRQNPPSKRDKVAKGRRGPCALAKPFVATLEISKRIHAGAGYKVTRRMASFFLSLLALASPARSAPAGEVEILRAALRPTDGLWEISVTLRHADSGWDHYADLWRVVSEKGEVIATRPLLHPHVAEQPFTRSLSGVALPEGPATVFIEAHDKVHGWAKKRVKVELPAGKREAFEVIRR